MRKAERRHVEMVDDVAHEIAGPKLPHAPHRQAAGQQERTQEMQEAPAAGRQEIEPQGQQDGQEIGLYVKSRHHRQGCRPRLPLAGRQASHDEQQRAKRSRMGRAGDVEPIDTKQQRHSGCLCGKPTRAPAYFGSRQQRHCPRAEIAQQAEKKSRACAGAPLPKSPESGIKKTIKIKAGTGLIRRGAGSKRARRGNMRPLAILQRKGQHHPTSRHDDVDGTKGHKQGCPCQPAHPMARAQKAGRRRTGMKKRGKARHTFLGNKKAGAPPSCGSASAGIAMGDDYPRYLSTFCSMRAARSALSSRTNVSPVRCS